SMKKIFTLLCALVITICASAQVEKQELVSARLKTITEDVASIQLQGISANQSLKVNRSFAGQTAIFNNRLKANHQKSVAKRKSVSNNTRKAAGANVDVTAVDWYYDDYYCDVYLASEDATYIFELTEDLQYGKTYTYSDMVPDWVCTLDPEGYPEKVATDATLKVSKDADGLVHIIGTMVLEGDNYTIKYDETPFVPSGVEVTLDGTDLAGQYISSWGWFIYTAKVGDMNIQLTFDVTSEKSTYAMDEFIGDGYSAYYSDDMSTVVEFVKAASDFTVTNTETTKTLSGSVYAKNGDKYNLNLVFEKPDMLRATIFAENASLTNRTQGGGYFTIGATTADKTMSADFYIVSKGLQGTFTGDALFADYCDIKVNKESFNIDPAKSELKGAFNEAGDSLVFSGVVYGTSSKGQMGEFTIYLSTPFTQEWGEWADFAPFDKNTGKFTFSACLDQPYTQVDIPVQVRKDNTGLKQFKFVSWSKGIFTQEGIDLIVDMTPDNTCTVAKQNTGAYQSSYGEYLMVQDFASKTGQDVPSTYDPETGKFNLALSYFISLGAFGNDYETMTMDREILERDTVDVKSVAMNINDSYLSSNNVVLFYVQNVGDLSLFRVTSDNTTTIDGTFKWSDGTINDLNSYFVPAGTSQKVYFYDGEFTVESTATSVSLKGWMIGMDEKYYRLDWTYDPSKLQYDTPDKPFNAEYTVAQSEASINVGKITITAFNGETELGLQLFTRMTNKSIPEGVFEISDVQASGTAQKSKGYIQDEGATPCYAATLVEEDGKLYLDEMWFMVEGTVTTSYDALGKLNVVVEGKNSYGQDIKAVITSNIDIKGEEDFKGQMLMSSDDYVEKYGLYQYIGAVDEENMIQLFVSSKTETGSFDETSIDFFDSAILVNGNQLSLLTGEFTVAREGENLSLKGWVVANDHIKYNLDFDNSLLVGVESISAKKAQPATFYNIMGQKVSTLTNGQVYISEGKKFLKK
ncbi:MAG: hypothetical protein KBT06_11410, partial [Prevotellaceae bacterium]|nr:hypothetical protein [Candidatus Colivivens equi]